METFQIGFTTISYLGHVIKADGVSPMLEKVKAMRNFPTTGDIKQLD